MGAAALTRSGSLAAGLITVEVRTMWKWWQQPERLDSQTMTFLIEEYQATRERILKSEERRYQLIVLNITALGAIFGFSDEIGREWVPLALIGILLVCSTAYCHQTRLQRSCSAYIMERFEGKDSYLRLVTGLAESLSKNGCWSNELRKILHGPLSPLLDPFALLLTTSVLGGIIISRQAISDMWTKGAYYPLLVVGYIIILCGCCFIVGCNVARSRSREDQTLREWWAEFLWKEKDWLSE